MRFALALYLTLPAGHLAAAADVPTLTWIQAALEAWQVACRADLHLPEAPLPWMIFYDATNAWHINPQRELLPSHARTSQSVRFSGRTYEVLEMVNQGGLWVPGRDVLPVVPKVGCMLYAGETKPFFIAASPPFQERVLRIDARDSQDFRNLLLGTVLHELTHTRQMAYVMPQIRRLRSRDRYPESLDDNVIQTAFAPNDGFHRLFDEEQRHFSAAIMAGDSRAARAEARQALQISDRRRRQFFVGDYAGWSDMEDVFLALEGLAMWVQFQSALRLAPRGQPWQQTLATLGQRTDAWSQAEGLALFLLIDRFNPGWQSRFFGGPVPSPRMVLYEAVQPPSR